MNTVERMRRKVMMNKRNSMFVIGFTDMGDLPPVAGHQNTSKHNTQTRQTIDSESNYSLFPLLNIAGDNSSQADSRNVSMADSTPMDKIQLSGLGRDRQRRSKALSCRKWIGRHYYETNSTVENDVSLTARAMEPASRISQADSETPPIDLNHATFRLRRGRHSDWTRTEPSGVRNASNGRPANRSPTRRNNRLTTRGRRNVSPKKTLSLKKKNSISPWDIEEVPEF